VSRDLSVIITTHNRAQLLDEALESVARQRWTGDWDVVVVDNASTDETKAVLNRWCERVPVPLTVVHATDGQGPSYARNVGVATSEADAVAFLDDDDIVGNGWVAAMGNSLESVPLVGSRYDYDRLNNPDAPGTGHIQQESLADAYGFPTVSGGGMGCRRTLWSAVGGSDTSLRFGEDIDFSIRVTRDLGIQPVLCKDAVYHVRMRTGLRTAWKRGMHLGRASVHLHRLHGGELGVAPDRLQLLAKVWIGYVLRLPSLRKRSERTEYFEQLGRRIGRLRGSVSERVWFP